MAASQILTQRVHHSQVTSEQSEAIMALRADFVAQGRPADHQYAAEIAMIEYDRPAVGVRTSRDGYTVVTL